MADWYPPERPSSHRAGDGARRAAARLAAPLTAVVVVVVVIALLIWINGRSTGGSGSSAVTSASSHRPSVSVDPSPPPTHRSSPRPTPSHTHHTARPHPTHHPAPHTTAPPPAVVAFAPVEVLNNSRIHGLAHQVAAEVAGQGWPVSRVGNLQGRVAETTVYYPAGDYAAAEHLAQDFGQIQRLEPQSEGGLDSSDLVLVVTRFWTG